MTKHRKEKSLGTWTSVGDAWIAACRNGLQATDPVDEWNDMASLQRMVEHHARKGQQENAA